MRRTWLYSLFAGAMLIAFANMMVVKDLHHHEHACSCACCQPSEAPSYTEADDCPICHFSLVPQFAQTFKPVFIHPLRVVLLPTFFYLSYTTVSADNPSSRAPPAC